MKISSLLFGASALLAVSISAQAQLSADDMGLSKGSVNDVATPVAPVVGGEKPQVNSPGAPPQAPHAFAGMIPITSKLNACMGCHNRPADIGKPKVAYMPTAIPATHYRNTRDANATQEAKVRGQRYVCTQCHTQQMNVKPLVANQFK